MFRWEHSAILSIFIKLPFVIKIFVLSIFEYPYYTGFTVNQKLVVLRSSTSHRFNACTNALNLCDVELLKTRQMEHSGSNRLGIEGLLV